MTKKSTLASLVAGLTAGGLILNSLACSDDDSSTDGASGSSGTAGAGGTQAGTGGTSTGGTGGNYGSSTGGASGATGGASGVAGATGGNAGAAGKDAGTTCNHWQTGECGDCWSASCCSEAEACNADPACKTCLVEADPGACHASDETFLLYETLTTCQGAKCAAECLGGGQDGGQDGGMDCSGYFGGQCDTCIEQNCCKQLTNCVNNHNCYMGMTTGDVNYFHSDATAHNIWHALLGCLQSSCNAECLQGQVVDAVCDAPATAASLGACVTVDGTKVQCNPVTGGCRSITSGELQ